MLASLSFTLCNVFIGEISDLGFKSVIYFCSGSLAFSVAYFIYQREWSKKNGIDAINGSGSKVLLRTWDNRFDWYSVFLVLVGGFNLTCLYLSMVLTFKLARMADLNIGIAQSIWAVIPFFISIMERFVYGTPFDFKQIYGMLTLVLCALFLSLS